MRYFNSKLSSKFPCIVNMSFLESISTDCQEKLFRDLGNQSNKLKIHDKSHIKRK